MSQSKRTRASMRHIQQNFATDKYKPYASQGSTFSLFMVKFYFISDITIFNQPKHSFTKQIFVYNLCSRQNAEDPQPKKGKTKLSQQHGCDHTDSRM